MLFAPQTVEYINLTAFTRVNWGILGSQWPHVATKQIFAWLIYEYYT